MEKIMQNIIKRPSAWLPIVISLVSLAFVLGYVAMFGIVQNEDEGTPARLFQLLMLTQAIIIVFFAVKWLPKEPKWAALILALQVTAALIPITTIIFLEM